MKESESVVFEESGFDCRFFSRITNFFWTSLDFQNSEATIKVKTFAKEHSPKT